MIAIHVRNRVPDALHTLPKSFSALLNIISLLITLQQRHRNKKPPQAGHDERKRNRKFHVHVAEKA